MRKLPPLNALRAFEATGRHLSISKAADELHVTPAAVSHQVKALEEYLGTPLLKRLNRAVVLTEAGQVCLPLLSDGMDKLAEGVRRIATTENQGSLTVSVAPSFATKWLVPRVERFATRHPEIDLRVSANMNLVNFRDDDVDVAVRFGRGPYPDLEAHSLFNETYTPMCSPRLLDGDRPLACPADLVHHTLLHEDSFRETGSFVVDWRMWLKAAGVEGVDVDRGLRFNHTDHVLQAAIDGAGVALGGRMVAFDDLESGRLVIPFDVNLALEFGYNLVYPQHTAGRPKIVAFRDWILEEAAATSLR